MSITGANSTPNKTVQEKLVASFEAAKISLADYKRTRTPSNLICLDSDLLKLATYVFLNRCWKPFINWAGDKTLKDVCAAGDYLTRASQEGRLTTEHLASLQHRLFPSLKEAFPTQALDIFRSNTQDHQNVPALIANKHPHLAGFDERMLRQYFSKSFKRLVSVYLLSKRMAHGLAQHPSTLSEVGQDWIKRVKEKVEVFGLQFLFHAAKIPLLNQSIPFHLSFLDYLWSNEPSYYRGDGGALVKVLLKHLENTPSRFIAQSGAKLGVVTYEQFPSILENLCNKLKDHNYRYGQVADIEEFLRTVETSKQDEYLVIDVTKIVDFANPVICERNFDELKRRADECSVSHPRLLIAGVVEVSPGIGVYFMFKNAQPMDSLLDVLINFQSALGAYPEIVLLRHALIRMGYPLEDLIRLYPFRDEIHDKDLLEGLAAKTLENVPLDVAPLQECCEETLRLLSDDSTPFSRMSQLYFPLLQQFLKAVQLSLLSLPLDGSPLQSELVLQPVFKSLSRIHKRVQNIIQLEKQRQIDNLEHSSVFQKQIRASDNFRRISQEYYLIIEETIYLNVFLDIQPTKEADITLEETLNSYPFAPQSSSRESNIQKQSFVFNSGMACYDAVLKSYKSSLSSPSRPVILFMKNCYFELTVEKTLSDYLKREFDPQIYDEKKPTNCDILCLDLYPNYAPHLEVRANDVRTLVRNQLKIKKGSTLTVMLDTSTTIAWNRKVADIMEEFSEEITHGTLNFIVINSLAKFSMCGFDKYPGGLAQSYCQVTGSQTSSINKKLEFQVQQVMYEISSEARKFFSFFIQGNKEQIEKYIERVNDNTDYVYDRLKPILQREEACLLLGQRDSLIPMMGLHFTRFFEQLAKKAERSFTTDQIEDARPNLVYLMYYYLYVQANKQGLPIMIRPSFGFPHVAFTECWSNIRVTMGIEEDHVLDGYVQFFERINQKMEVFIFSAEPDQLKFLIDVITHPPKVKDSGHIPGSLSTTPATMRKFIEHHETRILEIMQADKLSECLSKFKSLIGE